MPGQTSLKNKSVNIELNTLIRKITSSAAQFSPAIAEPVMNILAEVTKGGTEFISSADFKKIKGAVLKAIRRTLSDTLYTKQDFELYPSFSIKSANQGFVRDAVQNLEAAFERIELQSSLTNAEKIEMLRGMLTTRYLDARLKRFFMTNEIKTPAGKPFQGKGFRSMGQEAIYAAAIRLKRIGPDYTAGRDRLQQKESYEGDYAAVMIRDLGLALAMGHRLYDVMAAQMGKTGNPTNGKDLHIGDMSCGVLPPAAPIALSTGNAIGMALALKGTKRVVINCNGEGGTSAGEWHEAINFAAVQKLPVVFIVQNNQTALSTPTNEQFASKNLAQKAAGYGLRAITIDGTDPEAIFTAVTDAAETCRKGLGPVLVELLCLRMCGHAHHDDMLYFGEEPDQFFEYPKINETGYIDKAQYEYWKTRDPIANYKQKLLQEGSITDALYLKIIADVKQDIETAAQQVIDAPWPDPTIINEPVFTDGNKIEHFELNRTSQFPELSEWQSDEPVGFTTDPQGKVFWQAIVEALSEEMGTDPSVFILGQDVGGLYGNAFVLLKSLLPEFGERILNTPLSESAIISAATGAAILGKRPVAEIQFNDFVASGFNQLVNNTAKIYARWQQPVPVTIRLPWGGLRNAGPYHSQNTEAWFYRTPGLKIVCPATPREAKGLLKAAIRDNNPVLYYEHIALYRNADIKQQLPTASEDFVIPIGKAHLKRDGQDLLMITYGAYVHRCLAAAEKLASENGISCKVLDLRSLQPLDKPAILWAVKQTGRVLIVHEDSKTGGVGQSIAAIITEEAFEFLDAPVQVLGALDRPVPYSPPLEEAFLVSIGQIVSTTLHLFKY